MNTAREIGPDGQDEGQDELRQPEQETARNGLPVANRRYSRLPVGATGQLLANDLTQVVDFPHLVKNNNAKGELPVGRSQNKGNTRGSIHR